MNLCHDKGEVLIGYRGGENNVQPQTKGVKFLTNGHFTISTVR